MFAHPFGQFRDALWGGTWGNAFEQFVAVALAARIADGEKSVRIHGQDVALQAEVVQLQSASAHADANQLLAWLGKMARPQGQVYVVHGDMAA